MTISQCHATIQSDTFDNNDVTLRQGLKKFWQHD